MEILPVVEKLCGKCEAEIECEVKQTERSDAVCPKFENTIKPDMVFCTSCGNRLQK